MDKNITIDTNEKYLLPTIIPGKQQPIKNKRALFSIGVISILLLITLIWPHISGRRELQKQEQNSQIAQETQSQTQAQKNIEQDREKIRLQMQLEAERNRLLQELEALDIKLNNGKIQQQQLLEENNAYQQLNINIEQLLADKLRRDQAAIDYFFVTVKRATLPLQHADALINKAADNLTGMGFLTTELIPTMVMDKLNGENKGQVLIYAQLMPVNKLAVTAYARVEDALNQLNYKLVASRNEFSTAAGIALDRIQEDYTLLAAPLDAMRGTVLRFTSLIDDRAGHIGIEAFGLTLGLGLEAAPLYRLALRVLQVPVTRFTRHLPWIIMISQCDSPAPGPADAVSLTLFTIFTGWSAADIYVTRKELRANIQTGLSARLLTMAKTLEEDATRAAKNMQLSSKVIIAKK